MTATTLLTGTVSPSFTRMSVRTPAAGDGISASTLSVEISKSGSSRSTCSPTFLIQRTIVPSAIDSPIWGITTGVGMFLHVDGRTMSRMRGFRHCLRERGMGVTGSNQLLHRTLEPQRQHRLGHELRRTRANHVDAKHFIVLLISHDLHEPVGLARHLRAAEHAEWKRTHPDVEAAPLC